MFVESEQITLLTSDRINKEEKVVVPSHREVNSMVCNHQFIKFHSVIVH